MTLGKNPSDKNYIVSTIKWFSVLILVSGIINIVQESFGITIESPVSDNNLIHFFDVSIAPLTEEIGFRVLLIGLPLFAMYSHRSTLKQFLKSLWHPAANLHIYDYKRAIILITIVAIFFGLAHIISGEPWSNGKFSQAAASGIIIGWVYFRYGLAPAVLVHWATNYFIFAYVYLISDINEISVKGAFEHSLINSLEILFVVTGIVSVAIMIVNYFYSKQDKDIQVEEI